MILNLPRGVTASTSDSAIVGAPCTTLAVPMGNRVSWNPTRGHCASDSSPLSLIWAGPVIVGDLTRDGETVTFSAPQGFEGTVSCPYAVRNGAGAIATGIIDFVVFEPGKEGFGAWGPGPRSGDRWWTGFGDVTGSSIKVVDEFERMRGRLVDIIAVFAPKARIKTWDDIAGGAGDDGEGRVGPGGVILEV